VTAKNPKSSKWRIGLERKARIQIGWLSFGKVSLERFLWPQLAEKNVDCQRGRVKSLAYRMNCEDETDRGQGEQQE